MNSFAAFLTRDLDERKKAQFRKCQSIQEVHDAIGEDNFFQKLDEFDEHNKKVIELYKHNCELLKAYLKPDQLPMVEEFLELPSILYWRKA